MSVRATTRRERIRRPDGSRVVLLGAQPATGLGAIAAVSTGADTISGAARHALAADVIEPAAEAVVMFESLKGSTATLGGISPPAGVTLTYGQSTIGLASRRDNSGWGVARCDVDICDDPQSQAGPDPSLPADLASAQAPMIYTHATALDRAIANAQADPAAAAWALTSAPVRVNMFPSPSAEAGTVPVIWLPPVGATITNVATGGFAGPRCLRLTTTSAGTFYVDSRPFGLIKPGQTITAQVRMGGTVGLSAFVSLGAELGGSNVSSAIPLTASYVQYTVSYTHPAGSPTTRARLTVQALATATAQTLDFDAVFVEDGPVAGTYLDPAAGGYAGTKAWARTTENSATLLSPVATGTYSRPVDAAAPQLDLPGSKWVHRRVGALTVGDRMTTPWQPCSYRLDPGRLFTVAAWLAVTPTVGTLPAFRWVLELIVDSGTFTGQTLATLTSPLFSPADVYARFAYTLDPANAFPLVPSTPTATAVRAHLEVVNAGSIGAGATVSVRGAHMYAGPDRGDVAGLSAVTLPTPVPWRLDITDPADLGFKVTRIDVHGNDRVSQVTSASGYVSFNDAPDQAVVGASAGRLTLRVPNPATAGNFKWSDLAAEEISGGPGAQLSMQNVQAWHEVDVAADVVSLEVDRSTDADPGDSTIPIGNYAATTLALELDDTTGEYSLFGRRYIDLGHRVEAAVGVAYTNRCDDPLGVDAAAAALPSLTWPTALSTASPVVATTADQFGQVPPAPYAGRATAQLAYDTPMRVTSPALEGQSFRGQVWVRHTGDVVPTLYASAVRRYVLPGTGIVVGNDPSTIVTVPYAAAPNVWTLVKIPTITVPLGSNAVALSGGFGISDPLRLLDFAAPDFERVELASGDLIEVVETAPVGIFNTTSWDAATGGASVKVDAIDRLATAGAADLETTIHTNTTVEAELRDLARRYLDLGADQVKIVDQGTPLAYVLPAAKVSTQIADLAKVAVLTAFTDGPGRFSALLRAEVDLTLAATYLDDRNLEEASSSITPDVVRNDVTVKAHPVKATKGAQVGTFANTSPSDLSVAGWEPTGQEIILAAGDTTTVVLTDWQVEAVLKGGIASVIGYFDWQIGTAAPFNPFAYTSGTTQTVPYPPTANWGPLVLSGSTWCTATLKVYPTFGELTLTNNSETGPGGSIPNPYAPRVYVDHVRITGTALETGTVAQRFQRDASVDAFGPQAVTVDVRLAQSTALLPAVGVDVLDNFSLRDASGERWLPDLEVTALLDPWRELGDRVLIGDDDSSISGEFQVLSHKLTVEVGGSSALYLRRVPTGLAFAVTDVSLADDGKVTTY